MKQILHGLSSTLARIVLSLLLIMVASVGNVWAETYTIDFESATTAYTDWTFTNMTSQQINTNVTAHGGSYIGTTGGKSTASIVTNNAIASPTSITFYVSKASTNTTSSNWIVQTSTDNKTWTAVKTQSATSMTKGTWVEVTQDLSSYSNVYVRVYYSGSTAIRTIDDLTLTYSTGGTETSSAPTLTTAGVFTTSSYDVTITNNESGATVYYTTDGNDPTTSSDNFTGDSKTITIDGTTTVKAMAVVSGKNNSSVASATYTYEKSIANTAETAYTTAEAISLIDAGSTQLTTTEVYVKGTVSKVDSYSSTYGSITYWLDNDAFEVYSGLGLEGAQFTALTDINAGDDVIVKGIIKKYGTTYEFDKNNVLASQTKAATLSIADIAVAMGGTITPEVTTNIPAGSYTVLYSSNNDEIVTTNEDMTTLVTGTKTGSATITAEISATGYKTTQTTFTVTVTSNATLESITVGGDLTKSTYTLGDEFSFDGLTATGNYNDETTADLTSTVTWSVEPATLTTATTSVTVTATSGEISGTKEYAVTVDKKGSYFTIEDMEIGKTATDVEVVVSGAIPELAANSLSFEITDGSDYITLDTSTSGHAKISAKAPGTATVQATYLGDEEYGEYSTTFTVNVLDVSVATYSFSSFTSADNVTLTDLDGFTITLSKGTGSNKPAWNATSSEARVYAKGSLTVKATNADIKSIVYEYTVNANKSGSVPTIDGVAGTTTAGTWNADTKTWTGSDNEVTFSTSGSAGNIGFTKLTITYAQGTKTETSLAWSASEATVTMDANDNVFPTLTTTPENLEGVTYESSATTVATIAEDGTITLVAPGTTTITAKYAGDDTHTEATPASYTLTVNEAPFVPVVAEAGYETVDFTSVYSEVTSSQEMTTYKGTSFKVEFTVAEKATAPKYYSNGSAVRVYANNTVTITGAEDIKNVVLNYVSGYADANATTTLDGATATITFSDKARFTSITVFYKDVKEISTDFTSADPTTSKATIEALAATAKGTNTLIYAPVGSTATGENVVIKQSDGSYTCANFVVADVTSAITVPQGKSFTATSAKYTRSVSELSTETTYGTLCLPYAVKNTEDITYLKLVSGTSSSLSFEPITDDEEIAANTPCLYRRNATGDVNATATDVEVVAAETVEQAGTDYKLVGITQPSIICASDAEKDALDAETLASCNNNAVVVENSYYIKDSKFYRTNGYFRSKGFRAYIVATSDQARANALTIGIVDSETTGIQYVEHENGSVDMIFDAAGRRQAQAQKGLNIINGKKVIK